MEEKKKRGNNYTPVEKEILLELIKKYKDVIESKEVNANMIIEKRKAWFTVCQQYNAVAVSGHRTWQQLRHLYENIKQKSKRSISSGASNTIVTNQDAQASPTVAQQVQPLPNPYDDAGFHFGDVSSIVKQEEEEDPPAFNIEIVKTESIVDQDTDMTEEGFTQSSIPDTTLNQNDVDQELASTSYSNKPSTSTSNWKDKYNGQVKCKTCSKNNIVKQQYFKAKLKNAKLEYIYLINKNRMEINRYKMDMKISKLRLNKLKVSNRS